MLGAKEYSSFTLLFPFVFHLANDINERRRHAISAFVNCERQFSCRYIFTYFYIKEIYIIKRRKKDMQRPRLSRLLAFAVFFFTLVALSATTLNRTYAPSPLFHRDEVHMPTYFCAQYEKQFKLLELLEFRRERLNRKRSPNAAPGDKNKEKGLKREKEIERRNCIVLFPPNCAFMKKMYHTDAKKIISN